METDAQGFTVYSEWANGRLAQMVFVIGLTTEIASSKPMSEQILTMFSPLTNDVTLLIDTAQQSAST